MDILKSRVSLRLRRGKRKDHTQDDARSCRPSPHELDATLQRCALEGLDSDAECEDRRLRYGGRR